MKGAELGFSKGDIVQEYLFDEDVDLAFREEIVAITGEDLIDEDAQDLCDGAIIWWRKEDAEEEDLADVLVDAISNLDNGGTVWVLTPTPSRGQNVSTQDISDAAQTVGLHTTISKVVGENWVGICMESRPRA